MSDDGIQPANGDDDMAKVHNLRAQRKAVANTTAELAALTKMQVPDLAEKYREVFGEPSRTRNKEYLRKCIAWRIQELAEGGLSPLALKRIEELAPQAPTRWRAPVTPKDSKDTPAPAPMTARDSRLPAPGTVITRMLKEKKHEVKVLADGFEYCGQRYRSLSKIARTITGTNWNGLAFFGLTSRGPEAAE
jgi:hypothetical protein